MISWAPAHGVRSLSERGFVYVVGMTDEQMLPAYELPGPEARKLASLVAVVADLESARRAAIRLFDLLRTEAAAREAGEPVGDESGHLGEALYTAALITYSRAFASGRRIGLTEMEFDGIDGALEVHRYFRRMRDQHIAHNVLPFEEIKIGAVLGPDDDRGGEQVQSIVTLSARRLTDDADGIANFIRLIELVKEKVALRMEPQGLLVQAEANALGTEAIRQLPTLSYTAPSMPSDDRPAS